MKVKASQFFITLMYGICTLLSLCVAAEKQSYDEYALKTAFLYRSLHYIEWPQNPTYTPDSPLTICVSSKDQLGNTIKSLHLKNVNQHKIIVKSFHHYIEMHDCQVVYINKTAANHVLNLFENKNILTVSDYPGFIEAGGIMNLPLQQDRVIVEINHDQAIKHNIKISAKLLRIANVKDN